MPSKQRLCPLFLVVTLLIPGLGRPLIAQTASWTDFTFVAWVYWKGGQPSQRIFDFGQDTDLYMCLTPESGDNSLRFAITTAGAGGEQRLDVAEALLADQWVHIAVTLTGDAGQLYIDGTEVTSGTVTLNPDDVIGPNMWLARSQFSVDPTFNGLLDEVAVFDRALSADEISKVYSDGWATMYGKRLALHLDDLPAYDGHTAYDASGWRQHGTLVTADADNKAALGYLGNALSFDGTDDYLALAEDLGDTSSIIIDSDALTVERDGDGDPYAFKGIPFVASVLPTGMVRFSLVGDLEVADGETLAGIGSHGISLNVAGDVSIAPGAVIDVSAVGTVPGPGGGAAGQGATGGNGGLGGGSNCSASSDFLWFEALVYWKGGDGWAPIVYFCRDCGEESSISRLRIYPRTDAGTTRLEFHKTLANNSNFTGGYETHILDLPPIPTNQWRKVKFLIGGDHVWFFTCWADDTHCESYLRETPVVATDLVGEMVVLGYHFNGLIDEVAIDPYAGSKLHMLHMDESEAYNLTALPISGPCGTQGIHATLHTGDEYNKSTPGWFGNALLLDGQNDFVDIGFVQKLTGDRVGGLGGHGAPDCFEHCRDGRDGQAGMFSRFICSGGHGADGLDGTLGGLGVSSLGGGGGVGGSGGQGGAGGEGGTPSLGGTGGSGGDGDFWDAGDGGDGGNGSDGSSGQVGNHGQDGNNGSGGQNAGVGTTSSGGGGGGGGGAGGGGGGGGEGTSGAGGGGGGGGGGQAVWWGRNGGDGGSGGAGGYGGHGGLGGNGGMGGGGGGALEIIALGRLVQSGQILASGGGGRASDMPAHPGTEGLAGQAGASGMPGGTHYDAGDGGDGGDGGHGGHGGSGADGGNGGAGGGGAGGTVKLAAFWVDSSGATIVGSGGTGGDPGNNDGGSGRFLLGQTFEEPFAGTVVDAQETVFEFIPSEPNPFVAGNLDTPFMPTLIGGVDIYGRAEGITAEQLGNLLGDVPPQAGLAMILTNRGLPGIMEWDIPGYDVVLVVNLLNCTLLQPMLGIGQANMATRLLERGPSNHPDFGGSGPKELSLGPLEVYATMVPEGEEHFNLALLRDEGLRVSNLPQNMPWVYARVLAYDQPLFLEMEPGTDDIQAAFRPDPAIGLSPLVVQFTDLSLGSPTSWAWDFGDGTTSLEQHPSHIFTQTGAYTVALTVTNEYCSDTLVDAGCVTVRATGHELYLPLVMRNAP